MRILGVGVDVVDVDRMRRILERHPRFASKHFGEDEIAYCDGRGSGRAACFAARWAAKEAFAKSLGGVPSGRWRDVRVLRGTDGGVRLEVDGPARDRMTAAGATEIHVSLAHERRFAVATCVATGP
jgi:holo-[acyl-carrier protein] synthase